MAKTNNNQDKYKTNAGQNVPTGQMEQNDTEGTDMNPKSQTKNFWGFLCQKFILMKIASIT